MKNFHYVIEKGEVGAADYYEEKRETVLETIKPICEAFEITDYDYFIGENNFWEILAIEGTLINCTKNSIRETVCEVVNYIHERLMRRA